MIYILLFYVFKQQQLFITFNHSRNKTKIAQILTDN